MKTLKGETVKKVTEDVYKTHIVIEFESGRKVQFKGVQESIHNDRWSAVIMEEA